MKDNNIIKYTGYALGLLSCYYIVLVIINSDLNWKSIQQLISGYDYVFLLLSLSCYLVVMFIGSVLWSRFVSVFSSEHCRINSKLLLVHAKSNIGKYLPGNVMHLIGRNVLGSQLGYKNAKLFFATLFEMFYLVIVGFAMVVFMQTLGLSDIDLSSLLDKASYSPLILVILALLTLVALIVFRKKVAYLITHYDVKTLILKTWFISIIGYTLAYLILGLSNLFMFVVLEDSSLILTDYKNLLFVYLISWLLGFIIPGPPGGLGVREAIYILLASMHYDIVLATTLALLLRVMNVIGDLCYLLISLLLFSNSKKSPS